MKKICLVLALINIFLLLAACGHQHVWLEATCTEPATCSGCGATEGEPAGHVWKDATCTEPKTCTVCGATEGELGEHVWKEATCTEPKTCTVCGATEGEPAGHSIADANYQQGSRCTVCGEVFSEPLEPDFVKYGLDNYLKKFGYDEKFQYVTCGYDSRKKAGDTRYKAKADVTAVNVVAVAMNETNIYCDPLSGKWRCASDEFIPIEADEDLQALLSRIEALEPEGYEWKGIYVQGFFTEQSHGYYYTYCLEDYYDIVGHDASSKDLKIENKTDFSVRSISCNYNGEEQNAYELIKHDPFTGGFGIWYLFYVPEGYDGLVVGLVDCGKCPNGWDDGKYIFDYMNDNLLLFRPD